MDLKEAFNAVRRDHLPTLLLELYGVSKLELLGDRTVKVQLDGQTSKAPPLGAGLAQGSALSPLLFVLAITQNIDFLEVGTGGSSISRNQDNELEKEAQSQWKEYVQHVMLKYTDGTVYGFSDGSCKHISSGCGHYVTDNIEGKPATGSKREDEGKEDE